MDSWIENAIVGAAAFIALLALCFSIWQGWEMRKHNRLSVKPHLTFFRCVALPEMQMPCPVNAGRQEMGIVVVNNGVGPAIIKKITVFVDGNPMKEDERWGWDYALSEIGISGTWARVGIWLKDDAIGVGETACFLSLSEEHCKGKDYETCKKALERLGVHIRYESIYGEQMVGKLESIKQDSQ